MTWFNTAYETWRRRGAPPGLHWKLWESAHSSKLWSGIIKPTLSVSSKTREKHIWQRRRGEKGDGKEKRDIKQERDRKGGVHKKKMKADGKKGEARKGGANREDYGGGLIIKLWYLQCAVLEYFKLEFWLDPLGETETSLSLSLFRSEEISDFQIKYSEWTAACWCVNTVHISQHINILLLLSRHFCILYSDIVSETCIINNMETWFHQCACWGVNSLSSLWP